MRIYPSINTVFLVSFRSLHFPSSFFLYFLTCLSSTSLIRWVSRNCSKVRRCRGFNFFFTFTKARLTRSEHNLRGIWHVVNHRNRSKVTLGFWDRARPWTEELCDGCWRRAESGWWSTNSPMFVGRALRSSIRAKQGLTKGFSHLNFSIFERNMIVPQKRAHVRWTR